MLWNPLRPEKFRELNFLRAFQDNGRSASRCLSQDGRDALGNDAFLAGLQREDRNHDAALAGARNAADLIRPSAREFCILTTGKRE
jgi:hypothetical protein